jgi:DNA-binding NtrC family response regulator
MQNKPCLHICCDLWEPSLSRALHESRRLGHYRLIITQVRSQTLVNTLSILSTNMTADDLALVVLLHAQPDHVKQVEPVLAALPLDLRNRMTLSCSRYSPTVGQWALKQGLRYDENQYEAPRSQGWQTPEGGWGTNRDERLWIQYRLMRALIAGDLPIEAYSEILDKLRYGKLNDSEIKRARLFFERNEPDMAGGQYAEERRANPNAIDLLRDRTVQVGRSGLNTLIVGETGTGKESLAWYLHDFSLRGDRPFLALNCAFFEGERLESELFGHEQGAFTDAKKAKSGLVEEANGGTLFLDELPEMAPRVQAKLLRFLQDGSYTRLGGTQTLKADVRVLSAAQPGRMGSLREDLYFRVADVELHTVPLRTMQPQDSVNLACNLAYRLMWRTISDATGERTLTPDLIRVIWQQLAKPDHAAALSGYHWPGNMRELSTLIKRLVLLGDDIFEEIRQKPSPPAPSQGKTHFLTEWQRYTEPLTNLDEIEQRGLQLAELPGTFLRNLVDGLGGRQAIQPTKLAKALGCTYNTLVAHLDAGKEDLA